MSRASRRANRESARRADNAKVRRQVSNNNYEFNSGEAKRAEIERLKMIHRVHEKFTVV